MAESEADACATGCDPNPLLLACHGACHGVLPLPPLLAQMPKLDIKSDIRPSTFAYPPMLTVETKKKKKVVEKAVLSTAGKRAKHAKKDGSAMEVEEDQKEIDKQGEEKKESEEEEKKEEKPEEAVHEMLPNPARVTVDQEKYILWEDERYRPITPVRLSCCCAVCVGGADAVSVGSLCAV